MKRLWIYGAGGLAREVLELVDAINSRSPTWEVQGFIVDKDIDAPESLKSLPVLKSLRVLAADPEAYLFVAVGASLAREGIVKRIEMECSNRHATLIHPRTTIGREVVFGVGTMASAGVLLTTDIKVGSHVHINLACTVGHDTVINDYASLNPRVSLSGNTKIGKGVEIGTGAIVIPNTEVGAWSIVGAGAVVTKSLPEYVTAVGVPAQVVKVRG